MSTVVRRFLQERSPDRFVIGMTIEEALHYSAEERQRIIDSYPPHERECRTKGIPVLGSGRIFPVEESKIVLRTSGISEATGLVSVEWILAGITLSPQSS